MSLQSTVGEEVGFTDLKTSMPKVRDKPKETRDTPRLSRPSKMTGRRPIKSDNRLHCHVVKICTTEMMDSCTKTGIEALL